MLWLTNIVLALALTLSCSAQAETFKLVTFEYPPYEYTEDGGVKGMAVDVVREVFHAMGHDVAIESLPWARAQMLFERGDVDGIFTFFQNEERQAYTLYSRELLVTQTIALWVLKGSAIEFGGDLSKLQPYSIGITPKTSYGERFDTAMKYELLRTDPAPTIEGNIRKLVSGRIDVWVSNRDGAIHELKRLGLWGQVRELKQPVQVVPAFIGFSKTRNHAVLRDAFDQALQKLKQSGGYDRLLRKYTE